MLFGPPMLAVDMGTTTTGESNPLGTHATSASQHKEEIVWPGDKESVHLEVRSGRELMPEWKTLRFYPKGCLSVM